MSNYVGKVHSSGPDVLTVDAGGLIALTDVHGLTINGVELQTQYKANAYLADGGSAGSTFLVCPFAGTIVSLSAVNFVANATTKTVLLAKIAGVTVTAPAWEILVTAAAGTGVTVVPTAANVVTAGQVLEIASDGGSSSVMPVSFTVVIQR